MTFVIHHGDCLDVLRGMAEQSVDAVVTDPPYGLSFMGKHWDYDVPNAATWREVLRVMRPGAHLLAFFGSRTYHRGVVQIEDAGFEIRDTIMWLYGSGFPKSHNLAGDWEGWGTALKPAYEPIVVARKPLIGTVEKNVLTHGTGALNIDGCRVTTEEGGRPLRETAALRDGVRYSGNALDGRVDGSLACSKAVGSTTLGRWPANVIHDGSEEVLAEFPESKGQSGSVRGTEPSKTGDANCYGEFGRVPFAARGDSGSAARFFYCAKASKSDRDEGLDGFEKKLRANELARVSQLEGKESTQISNTKNPVANSHPTVKPTDLMRYLCRLVTPPGGIILDPFMGSGSTGKAAMLEGFHFIGCEMQIEYVEIARSRIGDAAHQSFRQRSAPRQESLL